MVRRGRSFVVLVGLASATAHARRGDTPAVPKVPTVEEVVAAEGFVPTPSQTELYRPGAVLVPNGRGGHDAVVEDCIGVEPAVSIMSQSSIATTLSAGVSTRLGVGSAAASAGVEKRLTFIDPEQRTISLGLMQVTDDCQAQLTTAARLQERPSAAKFSNTFKTSPTSSGSRAEVISSQSKTLGFIANERAIATRCC